MLFVVSQGPLDRLGNPSRRGRLTAIDISTDTLTWTHSVGVDANAVAVDGGNRVAVVSGGRYDAGGQHVGPGALTIVDARSGDQVAARTVGVAPGGVAYARNGRSIIVLNHGRPPKRGSLTLLEESGRIRSDVEAGVYPSALTVDESAGDAVVANFVSNSIEFVKIVTGRLSREIRLGRAPGTAAALALDRRNRRLFILSYAPRIAGGGGPANGHITIVDSARGTIKRSIAVINPTSLALNERLHSAYVLSNTRRGSFIMRLSSPTGARVWTRPLDLASTAIVADGRSRLFVLSEHRRMVIVLDARTGHRRCNLPTGSKPVALVVDVAHNRLFVANHGSSTVTITKSDC
jgi:DNA-binding beta-propeller fold protein YncE